MRAGLMTRVIDVASDRMLIEVFMVKLRNGSEIVETNYNTRVLVLVTNDWQAESAAIHAGLSLSLLEETKLENKP